MRPFSCFGLSLVLSATIALDGGTAYAGNDRLTLAPTQSALPTREFDELLDHMLTALIASAETDDYGEVWLSHPLGDQRFLEPGSGLYWQINGGDHEPFLSRSLWDRKLHVSGRKAWNEPIYYNSDQFPNEPLRVVERTVLLPGSDVEWQFVVARSGVEPDQASPSGECLQ